MLRTLRGIFDEANEVLWRDLEVRTLALLDLCVHRHRNYGDCMRGCYTKYADSQWKVAHDMEASWGYNPNVYPTK